MISATKANLAFFRRKPQNTFAGCSDSAISSNSEVETVDESVTNEKDPIETLKRNAREKIFGFVNFGNTCYVNSMLAVLFQCRPFREFIFSFPVASEHDCVHDFCCRPKDEERAMPPTHSAHAQENGKVSNSLNKDNSDDKAVVDVVESHASEYGLQESLLTSLKDIFTAIAGSHEQSGICNPQRFIEVLRRENESFRGAQHQDAHEFLNYLLNQLIEDVKAYCCNSSNKAYVNCPQAIFEGLMTSETKCLNCENITEREESFLDLSIDLEANTSVSASLNAFGRPELLRQKNKFLCDYCHELHEAEKRMRIKKLPHILALHLKRFQFTDDWQRLSKLFHTVVFPSELKLSNITNDKDKGDRLYELFAAVIHIGSGPFHGHYVAVIKTENCDWMLFDDDNVTAVKDDFMRNFFGGSASLATAYVLFYEARTASIGHAVKDLSFAEGESHVQQTAQQQFTPQIAV